MGKKADNALVFRRVLAASGLSDTDVNRKSRKHDIVMNPLSLSVSCHIGPGAVSCVTWV